MAMKQAAAEGGASSGCVIEPLVNTATVALWLGTSREQVWRLWKSGRLPAYRFDRNLRFAPADVQAFLEEHRGPAVLGAGLAASQRRARLRPATEYRRI